MQQEASTVLDKGHVPTTPYPSVLALLRANARIVGAVPATRPRSVHGLALKELLLLMHLERAPEEPAEPHRLAKRLHVSASTVTRMTAPMEKLGMVGRSPIRATRAWPMSSDAGGQSTGQRAHAPRSSGLAEGLFRDPLDKQEIATWPTCSAASTAGLPGELADAEDLAEHVLAVPHLGEHLHRVLAEQADRLLQPTARRRAGTGWSASPRRAATAPSPRRGRGRRRSRPSGHQLLVVGLDGDGKAGVRLGVFVRAVDRMSSGSARSRLSDVQNCCGVPSNILPQPSAKIVSPQNSARCRGRRRRCGRGVARDEEDLGLGLAEAVAVAIIDLDVDARDAGAVALGADDGAAVACLISMLPPTWSPWWWVFRIWVIFQRRLSASASTGPATAGSTRPRNRFAARALAIRNCRSGRDSDDFQGCAHIATVTKLPCARHGGPWGCGGAVSARISICGRTSSISTTSTTARSGR
jgi:hypothetical protein